MNRFRYNWFSNRVTARRTPSKNRVMPHFLRSALGQKRTFRLADEYVCFVPKAYMDAKN
jgi:hypothetical protein